MNPLQIAIVLTHNRSDVNNARQITDLLEQLTESRIPALESDGNQILDEETGEPLTQRAGYTINGFSEPHIVKIFQIVPFGVTPPANRDELFSYKVYYGLGDEDKTGEHPRFYNWGLKRSTEMGAEVVIDLKGRLDVNDFTLGLSDDFSERPYGIITRVKVKDEVGLLDERLNRGQAMAAYRQRIDDKGLKRG